MRIILSRRQAFSLFFRSYPNRGYSRVHQFTVSKPNVPIRQYSISTASQSPARVSGLESTSSIERNASDIDVEYDWIPDVEAPEFYEPGGYHPVSIGDTFQDRYRIVNKLGHGGYSTVWLARDIITKSYVALKIGISGSSSISHEIRVLNALLAPSSSPDHPHPGRGGILPLLDQFQVKGPNGVHTCYTMPLTRGSIKTANEITSFPVQVGRALAVGLIQAVAYMHSRGFAHGGSFIRVVPHSMSIQFLR